MRTGVRLLLIIFAFVFSAAYGQEYMGWLSKADKHYEAESILHFSEAAKLGHAEALQYALDALLFRANSLTLADPQKALDVYETAKKKNPSIELIDEEDQLDVIKKCAEAGPFDAEAFIRTYHLQINAGFEERWLPKNSSSPKRSGKKSMAAPASEPG